MINYRILLLLTFIIFYSCSKSDDSQDNFIRENRYKSSVFEEVVITKDVQYGANVTLGGSYKNLLLDVYEPKNDTETNRPLLVLAHGGSFIYGSKSDLANFAIELAKSGYVVAAINYRLLDVIPTQQELKETVVNALGDMKAAVRYFYKDGGANNIHNIDLSNIFIGGYSAGAIAALHYAYINSENEIRAVGGSDLVNYVNANGGLDGLSGNAGYETKIKAVINISGALFKSNFINTSEAPLFSIHGNNDEIVPYLNGVINNTGISAEGSGLIHPYAISQGVFSQLKTIENGKHDAFTQCNSCINEIRSFLFSQL